MRILFYDIEIAPKIAAVWGIHEQRIGYHQIVQDSFIICAAYKWLGEKGIETVSVLDNATRFKKDFTDDYHVIKKLHSLISKADVICAHNGDNFDWKHFMARVVYHGLPPIKRPLMVDTLKKAREFKFTSNKLDDLGKILGTGRKLKNDMSLWLGAAYGDASSVKKLVTYCKGDIPPLERLYKRLKPYMKSHPNANLFQDKKGCPRCGGKHIRKHGINYTQAAAYQSYECGGCGHRFQGEQVKRAGFK